MNSFSRRSFLQGIGATAALGMLAGCGGAGGSSDKPAVVGYSPFSSKFSPFFAESSYDQDAQALTQLQLFNTTRMGEVVYKGIEGETYPYNDKDYTYTGPANIEVTENSDGTVFYDITLRDDLKFSDGEKLTIDDLIFTFYVLCDPTFDGSATLFSMPIKGMEEYRSGMDTLLNLISKAGRENKDFSKWTEEQQKAYWQGADEAATKLAQEIVDYCGENGLSEKDDVAAAAANCEIELQAGAKVEDFGKAFLDKYEGNIANAISAETVGSGVTDLFPSYSEYAVGVETGESAANISGIERTGDYSCRVTASQVDATLIYQLGVCIAPLHYYGSTDAYDFKANKFGFPKGDLTTVRDKISQPLGAGPYKFVKFENGVINYEANELYYKGTPKTKYLQLREMQEVDKLNGVVTGTIDVTDPTYSKDVEAAISDSNGGDITGSVITTNTTDFLGYGYIGMNAINVSVGKDPASDASKNLRKALATILAVYRDVAIDSFYGDAAEVINYPISNTSWAAPHATDDGYKVAFSVDKDGKDIYTSDMNADAKYAAAKTAALGFLEAAGYTIEGGKATAAPEGAKLEYECLIPADGSGDHPSFMILKLAHDAFEEIGINFIVTDLSNSTDLWDKLSAVQAELWCAAWGATIDPDMTQIYYADAANPVKATGSSKNPNGGDNQGGSNYQYCIADPELDKLILEARASTDQEYRKQVYKACLDTVIDWACEIPVYQRQNAVIFSTERVKVETVTPDITPFYGWMAEIENFQMK